ncbi:MAG: diguanylate cyclase [Clostridia bacterium]|nr:diguanylate cyclase [Clostridia bacterium]
MHSLRTKITAMTIGAIIITMIIAAAFGVVAIQRLGKSDAEQMLRLLCEAGEKNLDDLFENLEQNVRIVSSYVESDLDGVSDEDLQNHLDRISDVFKRILVKTNGIVTYYYRIDPALSSSVKGFWFVNLDGEGFAPHEVTDITQYNTDDTSQLVWFTVPKATGEPVWLNPYITDNLDVRVISYNVPVYFGEQFVGVIGIELDYSAMAAQVDNITLYENGYAYITDADGMIVYHPHMSIPELEAREKAPDGIVSSDSIVRYNYRGTEKLAFRLPLINGNLLTVSAPLSEINASWHKWITVIVIAFLALLLVFIAFIMKNSEQITKPLQKLTEAAEQIDEGNYDCTLDYDGKDEIGALTNTFRRVTENLKIYISRLNNLAYADALTSLRNRGAFDIMVREMQTQIDRPEGSLAFAVCMFDCDCLKQINDEYGHDKGDIYLKETARIICDVFEHSPVFRIGGDEFVAILQNRDYENREALLRLFDEKCSQKREAETDPWKKVTVSRGLADYDPQKDKLVDDVVRHADRAMYENKRSNKRQQTEGTEFEA